jgi:hypothetical protein
MEHKFWLQIMGDHSRFIFYALSPTEEKEIKQAEEFIIEYDKLLDDSHRDLSTNQIEELNRKAIELTYELREFKLHLLTRLLAEEIKISLPPTFINHMINELEEYILVLHTITNGHSILFHPIHYHLHWLADAVGHAASVAANLDMVEQEKIEQSMWFEKKFMDLYLKSIEFNGYLRTDLHKFPSLSRLNDQAENVMSQFKDFLEEVQTLRMDKKLLGTLMPLVADHMTREECYYLWKLYLSAETKDPNCNPAKPRVKG